MSGRPRNLNPLGQKFLAAYLDPLLTPEQICRQFRISSSTFYNYEKELNLPQVRVGIGLASQLPLKRALRDLKSAGERYEIEVLRAIAQEAGLRMKLIPCFSGDSSLLSAVSQGRVDFLMASASKTRARARSFYFSDSYYANSSPWGQLLKLKKNDLSLVQGKTKPALGVVKGSIHEEYALRALAQEFQIVPALSVTANLRRLASRKVDFILANPSVLELYPEQAVNLEICSSAYAYDSHTGIVFSAESEHLKKNINQAIHRLHENGLLQRIQESTGLSARRS